MRRALAILGLVLGSTACGETNIQSIERLKSPYQVERTRLARMVDALPPPGTTGDTLPARLDPPMVIIDGYARHAPLFRNTEVLSVEEARDPEETDRTFEPYLSHFLSVCLAWTGPQSPLNPEFHDRRGGLGTDCEVALASQYLVLVRSVELRHDRFIFEAFVFDHRRESMVGAVLIELRSNAPRSLAEVPAPGPEPTTVTSPLYEAATCALLGRLARTEGSTVRSQSNCAEAKAWTEVLATPRKIPAAASE